MSQQQVCYSCGTKPAKGDRLKHDMCSDCREELRQIGAQQNRSDNIVGFIIGALILGLIIAAL